MNARLWQSIGWLNAIAGGLSALLFAYSAMVVLVTLPVGWQYSLILLTGTLLSSFVATTLGWHLVHGHPLPPKMLAWWRLILAWFLQIWMNLALVGCASLSVDVLYMLPSPVVLLSLIIYVMVSGVTAVVLFMVQRVVLQVRYVAHVLVLPLVMSQVGGTGDNDVKDVKK